MVLANKGEWDQAKAALARFLELSPNGLTEIVPVAPAAYRIYRQGGDTAGMAAALEVLRAHGMAQDLAPDSYNEGVLALKEKDFEEAERLFLEALELDPKLAQGHQGLAALHFNQQHYEQALPHAAALLAIFPRSRDGQRMAFFSHFELGHKDQAIASGRAWFELTEAAQDEVLDQAELAFEGNQPEVAQRYAEIVLAIDEGAPRAHYLLGRIFAGAGDIAGAKRHLQRFIELAPEDGEAAVARAMLEGLG
jgi:tetratricopeptide (TPR) repeat protein